MSWHTVGILIKISIIALAVTIVGFFATAIYPDNAFLVIVTGVAFVIMFPIALVCGVVGLLSGLGYQPVTCPLCGRRGEVIGRGRETTFSCSKCGEIHARGFFQTEYVINGVAVARRKARNAKSGDR